MTPIFDAQISGGLLHFDNKALFLNHLNSLEGKRVQVTVEPWKKKRSDQQNKYLWGVCYKLIADHTGAEPEEVHIALKMAFAPKKFVGDLVAPASTKTLDTVDFTAYVEKVRRWAAEELGVVIPDPNEVSIN